MYEYKNWKTEDLLNEMELYYRQYRETKKPELKIMMQFVKKELTKRNINWQG